MCFSAGAVASTAITVGTAATYVAAGALVTTKLATSASNVGETWTGNNYIRDDGRSDVAEHTNPHYNHNPWDNPNQHGPATPGLYPETPRW